MTKLLKQIKQQEAEAALGEAMIAFERRQWFKKLRPPLPIDGPELTRLDRGQPSATYAHDLLEYVPRYGGINSHDIAEILGTDNYKGVQAKLAHLERHGYIEHAYRKNRRKYYRKLKDSDA